MEDPSLLTVSTGNAAGPGAGLPGRTVSGSGSSGSGLDSSRSSLLTNSLTSMYSPASNAVSVSLNSSMMASLQLNSKSGSSFSSGGAGAVAGSSSSAGLYNSTSGPGTSSGGSITGGGTGLGGVAYGGANGGGGLAFNTGYGSLYPVLTSTATAPMAMPRTGSTSSTSPTLATSPGSTVPTMSGLDDSPTNSTLYPMGGMGMPTGSYSSTSSMMGGAGGGDEEVSTLFVIGFPDDFGEREFQNMFTFAPGYESAALKRQERKQGNATVGQLIGFVKFETRAQAEEARDHLIGRKVDAELGSTLKAEIAKKNLHTKRGILQDGQAAAKPRRRTTGASAYDRFPNTGNGGVPSSQSLHPAHAQLAAQMQQQQQHLLHQQQQQQQQQQLHQPLYDRRNSRDASSAAAAAAAVMASGSADWRFAAAGSDAGDATGNAMFDHLLVQSQGPLSASGDRFDRHQPYYGSAAAAAAAAAANAVNAAAVAAAAAAASSSSRRESVDSFADPSQFEQAARAAQLRSTTASLMNARSLSASYINNLNDRSELPSGPTSLASSTSLIYGSQDDAAAGFGGVGAGGHNGAHLNEDVASAHAMSQLLANLSNAGVAGNAGYGGAVAAPFMDQHNPFSMSGLGGFGGTGGGGYGGGFGGTTGKDSLAAAVNAAAAAAAAAQQQQHQQHQQQQMQQMQQMQNLGSLPNVENPPCNTLYVGNLPHNANMEELRRYFSNTLGYRRMSFQMKPAGPMCFVEYEDVNSATVAMRDLQGTLLSSSIRGGIRLSYAKNSLGTRQADTSAARRGSVA